MKDCENLANCGFFNKFQSNNEVIKNGWINLYCADIDKSAKCERKKLKQATGKAPDDRMAPTGRILPQ
ncbi:MAG: hypothetical protein LWX56_10595 [Ignavibacteria bacterium]|nr:hypothetical protein [Ignavibacteria bacterium]